MKTVITIFSTLVSFQLYAISTCTSQFLADPPSKNLCKFRENGVLLGAFTVVDGRFLQINSDSVSPPAETDLSRRLTLMFSASAVNGLALGSADAPRNSGEVPAAINRQGTPQASDRARSVARSYGNLPGRFREIASVQPVEDITTVEDQIPQPPATLPDSPVNVPENEVVQPAGARQM